MKIKTKLTLGVGLLFLLIITLGLVGTKYINALKADTDNILIANYNTLDFSRNMSAALEDSSEVSMQIFETNLSKQEQNITEIGEKEATEKLRLLFNHYKNAPKNSSDLHNIRKQISILMDLNMQAIQRKSIHAQETAKTANFYIVVTATLCFLIAFVLLINLPSNIANPIKELTKSIQNIANKKYTERVHFESSDEFGDLAISFNTMAEKLEEYNNSNLAILMKDKKRIEALINNMHDPVIGLDEQMKIIFANEEAIKITGLSEEDLLGKLAVELALKNDLIRSLIQDLILKETNADTNQGKFEHIKIFYNGQESYFEKEVLLISITPTGEKEKTNIGHVIILKDVTEYKQLDFAKTNFISTVSHEYKTPISSIKMSLQLLENVQIGPLNSEQKNLIESMKDDTNRLLRITGELLNITQVESGKFQLSVIPNDAKEILQHSLKVTKTQAEQKAIKIITNYENNLPSILCDRDKTVWVLNNIVSNAIRYSYEYAEIFINVFKEKKEVVFEITDGGQGISAEYLDKIFDKYFRIPGTKKEGTGLGLSISKEIIEAQEGSITVSSELGKGSTFKVFLPTVEL